MTRSTVFVQLASGLRRRRVRVWLLLVGAVVAVMVTQVLMPINLLTDLQFGISPTMWLALFLFALGCEYIDSALGMGYGTTLTPLLMLFGLTPAQIVPCVLLSECLSGAVAALMHHRDGNVDFIRDGETRRTAILLASLSAVGAIIAVTLALRIPQAWWSGGITGIILVIGVLTLATYRRQLRFSRGQIIGIGAIASFNKALSGGGYGPLVTAGQVVSGLSPKKASAITSLAESFTCVIGLLAYLALHRHLDWSLAVPLTFGALLSVPMATLTVRMLPEQLMRLGIGVLTILLGVLALVKLLS